jgi:hypothetical protein
MKNTAIGRRAYLIGKIEADKMVADGAAVQDAAHADIYEEITDGERDQGYMTRNMAAIPVPEVKKKPQPKSKSRTEVEDAE